MEVRHPLAGDVPGVPPATVDVNGESVPVDGGTFEVSDELDGWLQRFANAYDTDAGSLTESGRSGSESGSDSLPPPVDSSVAEKGESPFDPSEYSVRELREQLEEVGDLSDHDAAALLQAEVNGKNRSTAVDAIGDHHSETIERHHED